MCRLCDNEEESFDHLWLRRPAFDADRLRLDVGASLDELVRLLARAQTLLSEEEEDNHLPNCRCPSLTTMCPDDSRWRSLAVPATKSLAICVENRTKKSQLIVRSVSTVTETTFGFFWSVDDILATSVVSARIAPEASHLRTE